ncbi:MAG TPA: phospholipase domain-containing protein, partial [Mucilaginibacter sp.]|nr:phospholipase domain-containing protein [Mucilaginibacter sp.]
KTELVYHRNGDKLSGNAELVLTNTGNKLQTVMITDHAYKSKGHVLTLQPGSSHLVLDLSKSHRWYDFSIHVKGFSDFEKRYAGRVETGETGYTDPFMGRVA